MPGMETAAPLRTETSSVDLVGGPLLATVMAALLGIGLIFVGILAAFANKGTGFICAQPPSGRSGK